MKKTFNIISSLCTCLLSSLWCFAQETPVLSKSHIHKWINQDIGDTIRYICELEEYVVLSREGIVITQGHKQGSMSSNCGCVPLPHGFWLERYRNGYVREFGQYTCGRKLGMWSYFYDTGVLAKVETYTIVYPKLLTNQLFDWDTPPSDIILQDGPFVEYYPNGKLKTDGRYRIVEEFSETDSLITIDPETYEPIKTEVKGAFWLPRSVRDGLWLWYDEAGKLIKKEEHDPLADSGKRRQLEARYISIIYKN